MSLPERAEVGAVVAAGGLGARFGALKQFERLAGEAVLARAVRAAASVAGTIVVPVPESEIARATHELDGLSVRVQVIAGGATRALSVLAGLRALPELEWVVIHDAARPLASPELFRRVLAKAAEVGGAICALGCADTVKRARAGLVQETIDRREVVLVQTPQVFRRARLLAAYDQLGEGASGHTDDASVFEAAGGTVAWVEGERSNRKITSREDLVELSDARGLPRIGVGYDVHPFAAGRRLILGGVAFEGDGLAGDSDADIVAHAVTDAVLGAAGLGDLGRHFPPGDARFQGARSLDLLAKAVALARAAGYRVGNVDLTIAARRPRIADKGPEMARNLARVLEVDAVNVKATSGDGLGFVGRAEGIAVHAVALLWRAS